MQRRTFLTKTSLLAAGTLVASCETEEDPSRRDSETANRAAGADGEWQRVREQFRLSAGTIHMSALLMSTHPQPVRKAIDRYRRRLDEDPVTYLEAENNQRKHDVRMAAADYLGGRAEDIALTDSTTMGIALVYHGLPLRPGQDVVTTEHAYYATHEALRQTADRTGATVREIALYDEIENISTGQIVDRVVQAIRPSTRALALTWVHSSTGLKVPVASIAEAIEEVNRSRDDADRVLICLDGVHGFGVENTTAEKLGCDFFMAGCHKWLFGPRGTGIVWGQSDAWAALRPMIPSFMDDGSWNAWAKETEPPGPTTAARMSPGGFKPFEHQWAMADAFRFHLEIGKARVAERTHALAAQLKEGLAELPHVRLYTPRSEDLSAGIVCFDIDGLSPEAVVDRLAERNIVATTTPYAVSYPRLTPSIYNTPGEVETVLREIRALA